MRSWGRLLVAIVVALAAATVPTGAALACRCAFSGYPEAVGSADVAFIGTVIGEDEPDDPAGVASAIYAFDVRSSKAPIQDPFEVATIFGNGANCGLDMAVGEEWLVIASVFEGRLETNLCTGTVATAGLEPDELAQIEGVMTATVGAGTAAASGGLDVPTPILLAGLGALVIGFASLAAFRTTRRQR